MRKDADSTSWAVLRSPGDHATLASDLGNGETKAAADSVEEFHFQGYPRNFGVA